MEIFKNFKYKSLPKNNPYAPEWNLSIDEFRFPDKFCNELKKELKKVIDIKSSWKSYNIFSIERISLKTIDKICHDIGEYISIKEYIVTIYTHKYIYIYNYLYGYILTKN